MDTAIDDVVSKYVKDNEIRYELRAVDKDDHVIAKRTSYVSAEFAATSADQIDEMVAQAAIDDKEKE